MIDLKEVLAYALGGNVPEGFLNHLIERRYAWDVTFVERLNDLAYELRPDLAVWEIVTDEHGRLYEYLLPLVGTEQDLS